MIPDVDLQPLILHGVWRGTPISALSKDVLCELAYMMSYHMLEQLKESQKEKANYSFVQATHNATNIFIKAIEDAYERAGIDPKTGHRRHE